MSIDTSKIKDQALYGIAEALGDAYDCMRVWSAWGVGTMGPDDFALVVEDESRLEEITDAALALALSAIDAQAAEIEALRQPWQPIETAPRALGTLILGRLRSGRICTITPHYSVIVGPEKAGGGRETIGQKFNGYSEDCGDSLIPRTVSHWMPLPAPPAALSGESNASD